MHARTRSFAGIALATLGLSAVARAQTAGELAAYDALVLTPIGALTPLMTSTITGGVQQGVHFAVRYAYMRDIVSPYATPFGGVDFAPQQIGANNFAASAILPAGLGSTISLTAGAFYPTCQGCSAHLMLSGGGDLRLTSMATGDDPRSALFIVGLNGELGFGAPSDVKYLAGSVGIPLSLVQRGQGMRIAAFVIPQLGLGTAYYSSNLGGGSDSGTRFGVGGGFGLYNPASTIAVTLGAQYIDFSHSSGVYGLTVRFGQ